MSGLSRKPRRLEPGPVWSGRITSFLALAALLAFASGRPAGALVVDYTSMGTLTAPAIVQSGLTTSGSNDVYVFTGNGAGIVGPRFDIQVNFAETIIFTFNAPAQDVVIELRGGGGIVVDGKIDGRVDIRATQPGGISAGLTTVDLFGPINQALFVWDISALFGNVVLESFQMSPAAWYPEDGRGSHFTVGEVRWEFVPEPASATLLAWIAIVFFFRARR